MFAVLFSKSMDPFYEIFFSFPTVIFSFALLLALVYAIVAMFGMVDLDHLNPDVSGDVADGVSAQGVLAGLMLRFGLAGVPLMILFPVLALVAWSLSFTLAYLLPHWLVGGLIGFVVGIPQFFLVLYVAGHVTGFLMKPMRKLFHATRQDVQKEILGQIAIVRTSRVDQGFGEATVADGGAGLIVKVRAYRDETFKRGDRVVLLEYDAASHVYKVISEKDFGQ